MDTTHIVQICEKYFGMSSNNISLIRVKIIMSVDTAKQDLITIYELIIMPISLV